MHKVVSNSKQFVAKYEAYPLIETTMPRLMALLREYADQENEQLFFCVRCGRPFVTSPWYRDEEICLGCLDCSERKDRVKRSPVTGKHLEQIKEMRERGMTIVAIGKHLGIGYNSIWHSISRHHPELKCRAIKAKK